MVSFTSGTLSKNKPCCKFMLTCDIENYLQEFVKTLSHLFQRNTTHTDLVMSNGIWLRKLNIFTNFAIPSEKKFVLLNEICKIYKIV